MNKQHIVKVNKENLNIFENYINLSNDQELLQSKISLLMYQFYDGYEVIEYDDMVFLKQPNKNVWTNPFCKVEDYSKALDRIKEIEPNPIFVWCTEEFAKFIETADHPNLVESRDMAQYVYLSEKMATLSGKKLQSKRNFINRFKTNYLYNIEEITNENIVAVKDMILNNSSFDKEVLNYHYEAMDLREFNSAKSIVVYVDKEVAGVAMFDVIADVTVIYIAIANIKFDGIFNFIFNEIAKMNIDKTKYICLEDDSGIEGLRKSKLSWRPEKFIRRYNNEY